MSEENADENPVGRQVIFIDDIVNTITGEVVEDPEKEFGSIEAANNLWNSAPSEQLKKKRGLATHVVRTKCGYDIYFHVGVG